jgi:hypothetical protein
MSFIVLNSNPLRKHIRLLTRGIFSGINNQYYLLEKLQERIKKSLKIESNIVDEENLSFFFNQSGKILIIQADDYTEKGEITYESIYGESEILSNETLKNLLPVKIKYTVVILCFIKSGKLKNLFEDKTQYLITFDDIDCCKLNNDIIYKYKNNP